MSGLNLTLPLVLDWGHAPFAVKRMQNDRVVFYPNGMKLKFSVKDSTGNVTEVYESVRVTGTKPEHQFALKNGERRTEWLKDRNAAFSKLSLKFKERVVILGTSYEPIQKQIKDRFRCELVTKKSVTWGDEKLSFVPSPYGGWGLCKYKVIPNKEEIKKLQEEHEMEELMEMSPTKKSVTWGDEKLSKVSSLYGGWGLTKFRIIPNKEEIKKLQEEREMEELQAKLERDLDIEMNGHAEYVVEACRASDISNVEYFEKENQPFLVQEYSSPDSVDFLTYDCDYLTEFGDNETCENTMQASKMSRKRSADDDSGSCKKLKVEDEVAENCSN